MSKLYELTFRIYDVPKAKRQAVEEAISKHWPIDNWVEIFNEGYYNIRGYAEQSLNGYAEDFIEQIKGIIWEAAGEFVGIEIVAVDLESQPRENYNFDKPDYEQWKERG